MTARPPNGASENPILIAGGGIGGLSVAISMAMRGIASHVLEAEPEFSESGAGIQIGPNGGRILGSWGLGEALSAHAAQPRHIRIRDGRSGETLASVPLGGDAETRYGAPYYVAERRLLHRLLLEQARSKSEIEITAGFRVASFRRQDRSVAVMSDDGREVEGRALIGADGVHSRIRTLLFGASPFFSGRNAWRATVPQESGAEEDETGAAVNLWVGPSAHLVHYSCGPSGPLNAVAITRGPPASPGWGTRRASADLLHSFVDWAEAPWRILHQFDGWMNWPLLDMRPLPRWSEGRITLLGDAAHPLMPFLASGAVMAIEDAAVLAAELARKTGDPASAFRAYEKRRIPRNAKVRAASARMGGIYHMSGFMRAARNLTLKTLAQRQLLARNDWLYGYSVED